MAASNFNTRNDTFRKLFGNGLSYRVPRFQRDYSWESDEWDDLWQDILGTVKDGGEPAHYMGYLVLQSPDERNFDVIDGQQRLTTLSILVLAALRKLKALVQTSPEPTKTSTQQRLEGLRQAYIGFVDPVTLVAKSKLSLNRHDDRYFQTYLVPIADHLPQRGFKKSEHRLRKAYEWFSDCIENFTKGKADPAKAVTQLIDTMSDRLFFTVITVTDELNAYKVFETLNARGVKLSATDLLKNYLFSVLARGGRGDHELKSLEERWDSLVGRLGEEDLPDFLRTHWNSRHGFVRQAELFKTIRTQIGDHGAAFRLLQEMEADADTYLALSSPEASGWPRGVQSDAQLLKMFSVRQPFALLMAARRTFSEQDFAELLRAVVIISFRYNVIGRLQTSDQERGYQSAAQRISKGEYKLAQDVLVGLKEIYPNDEAFKAAFAQKTIGTDQSRNRRVAKYILAQIERQSGGSEVDFFSDSVSIEHVLPQSPQEGWALFKDEEAELLGERLGNMTLLPSGLNRDLANKPYSEKRTAYAQASYAMTRKVAEDNEDWAPDRIVARQNAMAKMATAIWRIAQLS